MQYKSGFAKASAGEGLRRTARTYQKWLAMLGYAGTGFVMANSSVFGGISPFGVAFCAALGVSAAIPASLGAMVGYIVSASIDGSMKYIAAVLLVASAKWLFSPKRVGLLGKDFVPRHTYITAVVTTFFALLVTGAAVALSNDYTVYDLVLSLSEILLACGATYFFMRAVNSLAIGWNGALKADVSCVVISFAIVIMGFSGIRVSGMSVGHIMSVTAILLCARYGGESAGAVAGVVAGIAMSLAGDDMSYVVAAYAFGGLVAGVFGGIGRIAAAASFIVVNAVVSFLTLGSASIYSALSEVFAASVIFSAVPSGVMSRLRPMRTGTSNGDGGYARGILRDRLEEVSAALMEIGTMTRKVSEGLGKIDDGEAGGIPSKIADRVCRHCKMKNTCWQFSHSDTLKSMTTAIGTLKKHGTISISRAPKYLKENCRKLDEVVAELNLQFQNHAARSGVQRRVSQVRSVVTDQFEGLSLMMNEIASEICSVKSGDETKARRVRDYLAREGISADRVQAYTDKYDRVCVAFTMPNYQIAKLKLTKSALDLCGLLEAEFDLPVITARNNYATVVFTEKAAFTIDIGAYQISSGGNRLCGDAYDYLKNKSGKTHFILSDGMGSGGNAAVDSSMATGLITQLLSVGISHDAALKMVNSALMIKSGEESLATIDVATVDLFTGRVDLYKAGAAPTYIVKGGRAGYIESASMPAGILRDVTFEHSITSLKENDVVVMVSDGVTATGSEWVKSELEHLRGMDMQRICEKLATTAKNRRTDDHEDDITVLAAMMRRAG